MLKEQQGGEDVFRNVLKQSGLAEADLRKQIEIQIKIDRLLDEICADISEPTNDDVQQFYNANPDLFAIPERIHAAHIVKHGQGNVLEAHGASVAIRNVHQQLKDGTPFENWSVNIQIVRKRGRSGGFRTRRNGAGIRRCGLCYERRRSE